MLALLPLGLMLWQGEGRVETGRVIKVVINNPGQSFRGLSPLINEVNISVAPALGWVDILNPSEEQKGGIIFTAGATGELKKSEAVKKAINILKGGS
jgi:hypothetical protein